MKYTGTLRSALAVKSFYAGQSTARNFQIKRNDGRRLKPFETNYLDWQHEEFDDSGPIKSQMLAIVARDGKIELFAFNEDQ